MASVTYLRTWLTVDYDPGAPCVVCELPVLHASMGGPALCPWCDIGSCRYCADRPIRGRDHLDACHPEHVPA